MEWIKIKNYMITKMVTEDQLKLVGEWKALADKYDLTLEELKELVYHVDKIKGLINK